MANGPKAINAPGVIIVLLAVFAAVHAFKALASDQWVLWLITGFGFIPARYGGPAQLVDLPYSPFADIWTFATYAFLHGDIMHLAVNGVWMLAFGSLLAWRFSSARFLVFSLTCAVAGALAHLVFHWGALVPVIGASAAISGQMAAAARFMFSTPRGFGEVLRARQGVAFFPAMPLSGLLRSPPALIFLGVWLAINLLAGVGVVGESLTGGASVAWQAHIGGFLAGLLLFDLFDRPSRPVEPPEPGPRKRPDYLRPVD